MKRLLLLLFVPAVFAFSCEKECTGSGDARCNDTVPTGAVCLALWQSWIYDASTKKCEFKSYSSCGKVGFETQAECEQCACNRND